MMKKLMRHTICLLTGRKTLRVICITAMALLFVACELMFGWWEDFGYGSAVGIQNKTNDTIVFVKHNFITRNDIRQNKIYPDSTNYNRGFTFSDLGEDLVSAYFTGRKGGWHGDSAWIYKYSGLRQQALNYPGHSFKPNPEYLLVLWEGPLRHMGDTVNHFFNRDSWDSRLLRRGTEEYERLGGGAFRRAVIEFVIYEADLATDGP